MKRAKCAVFVFLKDGKFLVEKRPKTEDTDPGKTMLPGGHREPGESFDDTLKRECLEELNVEPTEYKFLCKQLHTTRAEVQECHYYIVTKWKGRIKRGDVGKLSWLSFEQKHLVDVEVDRKALSSLQAMPG